jgi:2-haloacid dehalogenase
VAIRQVYFDLNGTLFDPSVMAEPLAGEIDGPELVEAILGEAVLLAMVETLSGSYRDFSDLLEAAAVRQLELVGKGDRTNKVIEAATKMRPFPDAAQAVATLRSARIGAGVLTNSSTETAESLVAQTELDLRPIVGTDQVQAFKPDARVYARGASAAGRGADEIALLTAHGWDAIGAKRAGLVGVWISRKERVPPRLKPAPDLEAYGLADAAKRIVESR